MGPSDSSALLPGEVIYTNSFETAADTAGWYGYGAMRLRSEAAPNGGSQSAYIAGGCIVPHAAYEWKVPEEADVVIRAFGKDLAIGGGISLRDTETSERIGIGFKSENWRRKQSRDTLHARAGTTVQLSMSAGGFVASAMLVDRLQIVKVSG